MTTTKYKADMKTDGIKKWKGIVSEMKNESNRHLTEDLGSDLTHTVTYNTSLVTAHTDPCYTGGFHSSPLHPR